MLKNWVKQTVCKTPHARFSHSKYLLKKYCLVMSALCNSLKKKIYGMHPYRAAQRMIDYMHLLQRRKKAYIKFLYTWSPTFNQSLITVNQQVRISLHQFDNCLSEVKISVITANNSRCPLYLRSVASSSSFIGTVSICTVNLLGCNFEMFTNFKFFYQLTQQ